MIGKRIKFLRKKKNITMKQLGTALGFSESNADIRIAQYENGTRTPKANLLREIANELFVSPDTISVPDLDSIAGVMHTIFIIEDLYQIRLVPENSDSDELNNAAKEWQRVYECYTNGAIGREQYDYWRYNFNSK